MFNFVVHMEQKYDVFLLCIDIFPYEAGSCGSVDFDELGFTQIY
jgi:hypothetical protein